MKMSQIWSLSDKFISRSMRSHGHGTESHLSTGSSAHVHYESIIGIIRCLYVTDNARHFTLSLLAVVAQQSVFYATQCAQNYMKCHTGTIKNSRSNQRNNSIQIFFFQKSIWLKMLCGITLIPPPPFIFIVYVVHENWTVSYGSFLVNDGGLYEIYYSLWLINCWNISERILLHDRNQAKITLWQL